MTDIISAIKAINPDAQASVNAEDINQITWINGTIPISNEDILAKQTELQAEYDALAYARVANKASAEQKLRDLGLTDAEISAFRGGN